MRRLGLAVAAIIGVLAGSFCVYAYVMRRQAESLVRNAYELSLSESNPTLADIQRRYGQQLHLEECNPQFGCTYTVSVSNRALASLHIFRYAKMSASFSVLNGVVVENMVDYFVTDGTEFSVTAHVQIDFWNGDTSFSVHPWGASAPLNTNGLVMIGYASSPAEKRNVLSFDTACMARIRGCTTVAELLPTVWQQTPNQLIRCRIANVTGDVKRSAD
jgi:hypothetical protein